MGKLKNKKLVAVAILVGVAAALEALGYAEWAGVVKMIANVAGGF